MSNKRVVFKSTGDRGTVKARETHWFAPATLIVEQDGGWFSGPRYTAVSEDEVEEY